MSLGIISGEESALAEARTAAEQFVHEPDWPPERIELVTGAFRYTKYDLLKRSMMKMIAERTGAVAIPRVIMSTPIWQRWSTFAWRW